MHVLRAEKGFVIVGQETDGTQTPMDLDMDWIVSKKKDFIGKRSFARTDTSRTDRHQLVGLLPVHNQDLLPEGSYVTKDEETIEDSVSKHIGYITSSYYSDALARTFALSLIVNGKSLIGKFVSIPVGDKIIKAEIITPEITAIAKSCHTVMAYRKELESMAASSPDSESFAW